MTTSSTIADWSLSFEDMVCLSEFPSASRTGIAAQLLSFRTRGRFVEEQPLAGDELRAIRRWLALREDALPWFFVSERRQPLSRQAVNYIVARAGERAGLGRVHPHMLRHSCGYALANRGYDLRLIQDYPGHRDPRHTAHYTRTAAGRFEGLRSGRTP